MRFFGLEVSVRRAVRNRVPAGAQGVFENHWGGWWPWIREPYTGAWQRNQEWTTDSVLAYHAVYACITLISNDIGKLRPMLVAQDTNGIWSETTDAAFSPVLRKPNRIQNHILFKEWWTASKLTHGNTYVLLERDERNIVIAQYVLDPSRVKVLVAPDGEVFYEIASDNISGVEEDVTVPASEIIHDRINCLFHPLLGTSPIFACGMAAHLGLQVQNSTTDFWGNDATPGGILTAPGPISEEQADKMSDRWKQRFSGTNRGKVAILGNGLTYQQLRMSATDAQLIEQLRWTAETVCSCFHVPAFKIGVGPMPTYSNGEILDQRYYSDCLQSHIEHWELAQDEGLGIGVGARKESGRILGVELELRGLLRMDTATQFDTLAKGVGGGFLAPNEARAQIDLQPIDGGDTVYLQQQNYSLAALDERDRNNPFPQSKPTPTPTPAPAPPPSEPTENDVREFRKELEEPEERAA